MAQFRTCKRAHILNCPGSVVEMLLWFYSHQPITITSPMAAARLLAVTCPLSNTILDKKHLTYHVATQCHQRVDLGICRSAVTVYRPDMRVHASKYHTYALYRSGLKPRSAYRAQSMAQDQVHTHKGLSSWI